MGRALLFLVDRRGQVLSAELRTAVEAAFAWVSHEKPNLDRSLLATWAEQVGTSMAEKRDEIDDPRRYAFSALLKKVQSHARLGSSQELPVGVSQDLEEWAGVEHQSATRIERQILFRELQAHLNDRDRDILILLLQDATSPAATASALGIDYNAAAKAVQRLKQRIRSILTGKPLPLESRGSP